MRRVLLAAVVGFLALTAPATATSTVPPAVHFDQGPGVLAKVTSFTTSGNHRLDVVRQGQVVGQAAWTGTRGTVALPSLVIGDVANLYVGETLRFSATYDGTPAIEGACGGRSSFTFTRGRLGQRWRAGVLTPLDYPRDPWIPIGFDERTDGPLTIPVTLPRPLALGDYAYAATRDFVLPVGPEVVSSRIIVVDRCPATPTASPVAKPRLGDAARKLRALRRGTLARATRLKLPMTFSEPGAYRVRIMARGGRTVAEGSRARTVAGKANVTLTVKRRSALRRATRVTLRATFTPARDGAKARHASTSLRLR